MTSTRPLPTATRLALAAADELGWEAEVLDPAYGYLFEVRRGGRRRLFLGGRSPLNDAVAARLAEDKHYSAMVLARAGLPVPETVRCLSPTHPSLASYRDEAGIDPGIAFAEARGFPLIVKPNRLSHGRGVARVNDEAALRDAVEAAWRLDAIALVQALVPGRDVRVDLLDGELLAAYERLPLVLHGDGARPMAALLAEADPRFEDLRAVRRLLGRAELAEVLGARDAETVLGVDEALALDEGILNLNGAATARVLERVPDAVLRLGARVAEAMGLRHLGLDLRGPSLEGDALTVLEVNASPLLSQLYLLGHQERAVAAQRRVLEACFAPPHVVAAAER